MVTSVSVTVAAAAGVLDGSIDRVAVGDGNEMGVPVEVAVGLEVAVKDGTKLAVGMEVTTPVQPEAAARINAAIPWRILADKLF